MKSVNGKNFTTYDKDNDGRNDRNCADIKGGGWWHGSCGSCNLNGVYGGDDTKKLKFNYWSGNQLLNGAEMKIRPKNGYYSWIHFFSTKYSMVGSV